MQLRERVQAGKALVLEIRRGRSTPHGQPGGQAGPETPGPRAAEDSGP